MKVTAGLGVGEPPLSDHRTSRPRLTGRRLRGRLRRRLSLLWLDEHLPPRPQMTRPAGGRTAVSIGEQLDRDRDDLAGPWPDASDGPAVPRR
jgi:hypothetical protein